MPWVYTVEDDLFVRAPALPSADSLSWEPRFHDDGTDGGEEYEVPAAFHFQPPIGSLETVINNERWLALERALDSDLFSTPIVHFLVSAFLGDGIDEFIGHLMAIEACLGLRGDWSGEHVVGARIGALLQDADAAAGYSELFNLRSEYVHGRPMGPIGGKARVAARALARKVANALIESLLGPTSDRVSFLEGLASRKRPKQPKSYTCDGVHAAGLA